MTECSMPKYRKVEQICPMYDSTIEKGTGPQRKLFTEWLLKDSENELGHEMKHRQHR